MHYKIKWEEIPPRTIDMYKRTIRGRKIIPIPEDKIKDGFIYINPNTGVLYERRAKNSIALSMEYFEPYIDCLDFWEAL